MRILNFRVKFNSPNLKFKKQALIVFSIVSLCYLIFLLAMSEKNFLNDLFYARSVSYKIYGPHTEEIKSKISEIDGYEDMLDIYSMHPIQYVDLFQMPYTFRVKMVTNIADAMRFNDAKLVDGTMPTSRGEVILEKRLASYNKLSIGDSINMGIPEIDGFKIVGIYESKYPSGFYINADYTSESIGTQIKITSDKFDYFSATMERLMEVYPDSLFIMPSDGNESNVYKSQEMIVKTTSIIFTFIFGIMTLCLFNISSIYLRKRKYEFQMLRALGYKHKYIITNIYQEHLFINMLGFTMGICFSTALSAIINMLYLHNIGTSIDLFTLYGFLFSFITVNIVTLITTLPIRKILEKDNYIPGTN